MLQTRGKRVVAEAVIDKNVIQDLMGVDTETLFWARQISNAGSFMAAPPTTGPTQPTAWLHCSSPRVRTWPTSPSPTRASSYTQLLDNGDYYWSITLPALIVATYGGGTGLATQRECLEMLGCYGRERCSKFAEICAAVVLAGDISLSSAIIDGDWVTSHDGSAATVPDAVRRGHRVSCDVTVGSSQTCRLGRAHLPIDLHEAIRCDGNLCVLETKLVAIGSVSYGNEHAVEHLGAGSFRICEGRDQTFCHRS